MVLYQREKWRGKQYVVVRSSKGRVLSRRRWTKKFTIEKGRQKYNKDRTLQEGEHVDVNINYKTQVVEFSRWGEKVKDRTKVKAPQRPSGKVQFVVEIKFRDPETRTVKTVYGRSNKGFEGSGELQEQARDRAFSMVHQESVGGYDEDVGAKIADEHIINYREGWIKYTGPKYKGGEKA